MDILIPAAIGVVAIIVIGLIFTTLYKRATRDEERAHRREDDTVGPRGARRRHPRRRGHFFGEPTSASMTARSPWSAVLSVLPALMSLLVVFGFLGLSGQPIDLGTSLVGSIVTSSGADFAMHYIWYLRRRPAAQVVSTVGPVIFTTAALLGLGMGVLMLGAAPPIRLFGGLSCAGMGLSAIFTFLLIPALIGKLNEDPAAGSAPH